MPILKSRFPCLHTRRWRMKRTNRKSRLDSGCAHTNTYRCGLVCICVLSIAWSSTQVIFSFSPSFPLLFLCFVFSCSSCGFFYSIAAATARLCSSFSISSPFTFDNHTTPPLTTTSSLAFSKRNLHLLNQKQQQQQQQFLVDVGVSSDSTHVRFFLCRVNDVEIEVRVDCLASFLFFLSPSLPPPTGYYQVRPSF